MTGGTRLADLTTLIARIQDEGVSLPRQPTLNFIGAGVTAAEDSGNDRIDVTIAGAAGGGYGTIQEEGTPVAQRTTMNFIGTNVTAVDNPGQNRTDITITGGGGGASLPNLDTFTFFDEFVYTGGGAVGNVWTKLGLTDTAPFGASQAGIEVDVDNDTLGRGGGINLLNVCPMDFFQGDDITFECRLGSFGESGEAILFMGCSRQVATDILTEAAFEAANTDACGFFCDPAISNNWRLFIRGASTTTVIQTAVNAFSTSKLKWVFDKSAASVEFFINGNSEGTINTNVPNESDLIPQMTMYNNVASRQTAVFSFFRLEQPRP